MASATVDSGGANTADGGALRLDSIPIVDLRLLSQSELYSLSRCSSSSFDPSRSDDVVIPIIDRSIFNESAGSRKQTYARLRLAPSSTSPSTAPHRRTPHLRSTAATYGNLNKSDPENSENAQIVNLLKELFVVDMNPEDLVPVKIEYANSIPMQQFSSPPPSSPSNVVAIGQKRKRGRPRKDEVLRNPRELGTGFSVVDVDVSVSNVDGFSSLNEIVMSDNVEERDKEVLNKHGVAVDLVALSAVEHPYLEVIRQRTEGLQSEEELLGFLKGLNGQWGSRRKKKRIVDASEFGSVLPVGWKLSLTIKKKNGHVWLYCRRYISPSGLHFVSCKGVSSYLLSLHGVHDANLHSSAQYNDVVIDADRLTSVPIVQLAIEEVDKTENLVPHESSPTLGSTAGVHDIQLELNAGDLPDDRIGESLQSNKSSVTFGEKDELLQQQSSLHRRNRYKNGMRITDGVIINDGKYECQFCHKQFSERHRYNGHVGTHVRHQAKSAGESSDSVIPNSLNGFPIQNIPTEGSLKSNNAMEICNPYTNNGLNISPCNNNNSEHIRDSKETAGNVRGKNEATDVVIERNPCSVAENKSFHKDACLNYSAAEMIDVDSSLQERRSSKPLPHNDAPHDDRNVGMVEVSSSMEKSEQIMEKPMEKSEQILASESCLLDSDNHVEERVVVNNSEHIYQTRNEAELNLDYEKFAVDGTILDSLGSQGDHANNLTFHIKEKGDLESLPCMNTSTTDRTSTFESEASKLNKDPNIRILHVAHDEKACIEDNDSCSILKHKVDEVPSFGKYETESSKVDNEMQFRIASVIPSWNEQDIVSKKDDTESLPHLLKVPGVQDMSTSQVVAGHESMYCYGSKDDGDCRKKTEVFEFDAFQNFGNGESSNPFSNSHAGINSNSVTETEQDRKLGICSPFTSATDKQLFSEDNMIRMFNDTLEEHDQEPSRNMFSQSGVSEVSDEAHLLNKIYAAPAHASKLNKIESSGKHELSLSFGNCQTDMCIDSNRVDQERYQANSFNFDSVVHNTYGNPTHLSIFSNIHGDLKQDRSFGIEFPNPSFDNSTHELGSSFNVAHLGKDWNTTRGGKIETSTQNCMVGFGNSSLQSGECVAADGSWRTGQENVFEGCFDTNSGPQIPSSSCFHTFGLTSNKGEEGSYGVNKNYDTQSNMLRPGRTQPVEYSFMGEQSSNSLPGEPKMNFSYNTNMEQGLDPSFWLGKDALTPNTSHTSQVTSICVWCRNVFFQEPVQAGMQTGAIGTMCPSCSSRIPGQFNGL